MNLKHVNGVATNEGAIVDLGAEEKYYPTCYKCYRREIDKAMLGKLQSGSPTESLTLSQLQNSQPRENRAFKPICVLSSSPTLSGMPTSKRTGRPLAALAPPPQRRGVVGDPGGLKITIFARLGVLQLAPLLI